MQARALRTLQQNLTQLERAAAQTASGLRVRTPSDDPVAAGVILRTDDRLAALTQYRRNIESAEARLASEESSLNALGDLLTRARELAISQGTATSNAQSRAAVLAEVQQLRAAVISLGNTSSNGAYLFGGAYADRAPLDASGALSAATPADTSMQVEIGEGEHLTVTHSAADIFRDTGAISAFDALITALQAADTDGVIAASGAANAAYTQVQTLTAEVGARGTELQVAGENIDAMQFSLEQLRSQVAEVDIETATMELVKRQTSLQAVLLATSKILTTSLTDYL
jgi:flagellar hook-associated protein 3 FlgL